MHGSAQTGRAAPAKFHNELALIYLRMATGDKGVRGREAAPHASAGASSLQQHNGQDGPGEHPRSHATPCSVGMQPLCLCHIRNQQVRRKK